MGFNKMRSATRFLAGYLVCAALSGVLIAVSSATQSAGATAAQHRTRPFISSTPSRSPTPTVSATPKPLVTPTPTSMPGLPTLIAPEDGAVLPQPVPPHRWHFIWEARYGPCWGSIWIRGPGRRSIWAEVNWWPNGYQYVYTQTEYLPDDALKPWGWSVTVDCPRGHNVSETRTFSVTPASWFNFRFFLPILRKDS